MRFSELTRKREIGVLAFTGLQDADLSGPQYDSRQVTPGSTFFAIKGFESDGHRYIRSAIQAGATVIVLEDQSAFTEAEAIEENVTRIVVANTRKALAIISEEAFGSPSSKLRLIGVTGTNGKTTTTTLLKQILELHGETVGLIGTLGCYIGDEFLGSTLTTPESRDLSRTMSTMLERGVTTCVMEVSSIAISLDRISGLDFDIGVFTNLTQDHLDFHQSMEQYKSAKQEFFTRLKPTAVAITNIDDEFGAEMAEHTVATIHSYGLEDESPFGSSDIVASAIEYSLRGTSFTVKKRYSQESARINSTLVGAFNVENLLAAIAAVYFGVEGCVLEVLSEYATKLKPVRGRFEQQVIGSGATVIIDYAHTPDALENVLQTIRKLAPTSKIITVFGCGGDRDRTKRPIMGRIAEEYSDEIIITNDNPRSESPESISQDIVSGIATPHKVEIILDRALAIKTAIGASDEKTVILIAGKGHEDYQIVGKVKHHFDDKEEVLKYR